MSDRLDTLDRARGRWADILPRFGINPSFLVNRHGPCPACGGKDRFRFDDRDGSGSFFCSQCGPGGSGILLIRRMKEWDHKRACDEVDAIIGTSELVPAPKPAAPKNDEDRKRRVITRALEEATDPDVAETYLKRRGLSAGSPVLRGQRACPYFDEDRKLVGRFPALVAPILGPGGSLESLHRIYDADIDPRKKTMPPVTTIKGGAVRLFECDEELAVAEGIETALAVRELFGLPVWACLTAGGIETFEWPAGLLRLHIYADNDENGRGLTAAAALHVRAYKAGIAVETHMAPRLGTDWLDVLIEQKGIAA